MSRSRSSSPAEISALDYFNKIVLEQIKITATIYNANEPEELTPASYYYRLALQFEANTLLLITKAKELSLTEDACVTTGIYKYLNGYLQYLEDFGCQIQNSCQLPDGYATFNNNITQIILLFRLMKACDPKEFKLDSHKQLENLTAFIKTVRDYHRKQLIEMINAIKTNNATIVKELLLTSPTLLHKSCAHTLSEMETDFNPGLLTAKYSEKPSMFSEGIFFSSNKKSQEKYLQSCPSKNKDYKAYNTLMVAAHWGSSEMFMYLLKKMNPDSVEKIFDILRALCAPYFKNNVNVQWLASHLDFYGCINDEDEEFKNEFPKFLEFTDATREKFVAIANLIKDKVTNGMKFPEYELTEHDTNTDVKKYNKKILGGVRIIPQIEVLPAVTLKRKR